MLGYWGDPERTREAIDDARWIRTGDLATLDDQGYCRIIGRLKDMVIRGGRTSSPARSSSSCTSTPRWRRSRSWGTRREVRGGALRLDQAAEGQTAGEEEIRAFCAGRIATSRSPLHPLREGVPDDRDGEDPEVRNPGGDDPGAPRRGREGPAGGVDPRRVLTGGRPGRATDPPRARPPRRSGRNGRSLPPRSARPRRGCARCPGAPPGSGRSGRRLRQVGVVARVGAGPGRGPGPPRLRKGVRIARTTEA